MAIGSLKALKKSDSDKLFGVYKQTKSKEAREILIRTNLKYVYKLAVKYRKHPIPFDDVISEGIIGLIKAVDNFDLNKQVKFLTYADWWIKAYMTRAVKKIPLISIPESKSRQLAREIYRVRDGGVMDERMEELYTLSQTINMDAIDGYIYQVGYKHPIDLTDKSSPTTDQQTIDDSMGNIIKGMFSKLTETETSVIKFFFDLGDNPRTLKDLSTNLSLTSRKLKSIKIQALKKMRINTKHSDVF